MKSFLTKTAAILTWVLAIYTVGRVGVLYAASFTLGNGGMPAAWSAANLRLSLAYTVPVLLIVLAHELGHLVACRRYGVQSSWPVVLPMPAGVVPWHLAAYGLVGAAVRVPGFAALPDDQRWDITASGLLAGAGAAAVFTVIGYLLSVPAAGGISPWVPSLLIEGLLIWQPVNWHPMLAAGAVGWILTAISLLPVPGFDGWRLIQVDVRTVTRRRRSAMCLLGVALLCWLG